jgi:plasmid stability protein
MTVLTVRDVPDEVKEALAREARERGQSLQAYLLTMLKQQADFVWNRKVLVEVELDLAAGGGADENAPDVAEVLARARAERDGSDT